MCSYIITFMLQTVWMQLYSCITEYLQKINCIVIITDKFAIFILSSLFGILHFSIFPEILFCDHEGFVVSHPHGIIKPTSSPKCTSHH